MPVVSSAQEQLFDGDVGTLPVDTRRVLVQLLGGPSVDGRRHPRLWPILLRDEATLRSRLHELFLELIVDRDQQVAFTRQVVLEEIDAPILLRRANLTFIETVLVLFLRQRLTQADAQGERAVVSLAEMTEHLAVFEPADNVDRAKFVRQAENAVEKAKKLNLVRSLKGGGNERLEVSPTLKLLFPPEEIEALTRVYRRLAEGASAPDEAAAPEASEAEEADMGGPGSESEETA